MGSNTNNVPIWLTVGFVAGLGFAWLVLSPAATPTLATAAEPAQAMPSAAPVAPARIPDLPPDQATLRQVEEFFMTWGGYCTWKNNVSQFVLWNGATNRHSDYYEVRRSNRLYYFRGLAKPDWPLIDHGALVRCPMGFAEPPEIRKKFYDEHPDAVPGQTTYVTLPGRPPLLPPRPPEANWDRPPATTPPATTPPLPTTPQPIDPATVSRTPWW